MYDARSTSSLPPESRPNGFPATFCEFDGADISGNDVSSIRKASDEDGQGNVPSSSAFLVDNDGIP